MKFSRKNWTQEIRGFHRGKMLTHQKQLIPNFRRANKSTGGNKSEIGDVPARRNPADGGQARVDHRSSIRAPITHGAVCVIGETCNVVVARAKNIRAPRRTTFSRLSCRSSQQQQQQQQPPPAEDLVRA